MFVDVFLSFFIVHFAAPGSFLEAPAGPGTPKCEAFSFFLSYFGIFSFLFTFCGSCPRVPSSPEAPGTQKREAFSFFVIMFYFFHFDGSYPEPS